MKHLRFAERLYYLILKKMPLLLITKRGSFSILRNFLIYHPFVILLTLIVTFIIYVNHVPGTYLSGWDTLHPEFNFELNFQRLAFGVFREEQGLGAVAAHSHMSDLPRVIILWISSILIPQYLIRYSYISLCLLFGALGMYFFIRNQVFFQHANFKKSCLGFLGALYYLLNLGTLQQFYVPFEMFTVQFAALPWLFLYATSYIKNPSKKNILIFALITLLATPMAYAATLWYAYFLIFLVYILFIASRNLRQAIILIFITLALNSFWLFPNLYFLISGNAKFVPQARINKIFSEEAFAYNKSYGNIKNALILKNFLFEWPVHNTENDNFEYLMQGWREHLEHPFVQIFLYSISAIAIIGIIYSIFSRQVTGIAFLLPTLISIIFLINLNPPFDQLFSYLRNSSVLFKESLRFPFTKFSIILVFSFGLYFTIGCFSITQGIKYASEKFKRFRGAENIVFGILTTTFTALLIYSSFPVFKGDLISSKVQIQIPKEYFEMFNWFDNQDPQGRVVVLPVHSMWGWIYYKWGFQGAQFVSFGIKQPLLDRDYDRWNENNEEFYRQFSYAIYSQNNILLKSLIKKYQIKYLVLDESILAPGVNQDKTVLFNNQTKSLFSSEANLLKKVKDFDFLDIYQIDDTLVDNSQVFSPVNNYITKSSVDGPKDIDWIYNKYGNYVTDSELNQNTLYAPFFSLTDNQNIVDNRLINYDNQVLKVNTATLPGLARFDIVDYLSKESTIPADIYTKNLGNTLELNIELKLFQQSLDSHPQNITFQIPFKDADTNQLFINLNQQQTIIMKNLSNSEMTYQGSVYLNAKVINNLGFYTLSQTRSKTALFSSTKTPFLNDALTSAHTCGKSAADQLVAARNIKNNGLLLSVKNAQGCVQIPFSSYVPPQSLSAFKNLVEFSFSTTSEDIDGHYCVFDKTLNRCIKEVQHIREGADIHDYLSVSSEDIDNLQLILYADSYNSNKIQNIVYNNFSYSILEPYYSLAVTPQELLNGTSTSVQKIDNTRPLGINFQNNNLVQNINIFDSNHPSNFCSNILPQTFDRKTDKGGGYLEYTSQEGSSCDYYSLPNLPHNTGYLLNVVSQSVSGLPLRLCVANNETRRCDVYLSLPANKQFTQQLILIPPSADGGSGYDIHLDNYAVGNINSVNRIKKLELLPFPYYWLTSLEFKSSNNIKQPSDISVNAVNKIFPGLYTADLSGNSGLVILNQSFDKGWWASQGKHIKVNGWANGWVIDNNNKKLFILFWPQLLELIGIVFIFLIFTLIYRFFAVVDEPMIKNSLIFNQTVNRKVLPRKLFTYFFKSDQSL